jgi:hypothetical protein
MAIPMSCASRNTTSQFSIRHTAPRSDHPDRGAFFVARCPSPMAIDSVCHIAVKLERLWRPPCPIVSPAPRGAQTTFDRGARPVGRSVDRHLKLRCLVCSANTYPHAVHSANLIQHSYRPKTRLKTTFQRLFIVSYAPRHKHAQPPCLGMVSGYCSGFPHSNVTSYPNNYHK